jgi:Fe-Mn family superoxide dismutase
MPFELPRLPYAYDALQPHMSKATLEFHHDKHHKAYVDTANKLVAGSGLEDKPLEQVIKESHRNADKKKLFNNAAQHWNHSEFWLSMKPGGGGSKIPGELERRLKADFGGLDQFKAAFAEKAAAQFGSGWAWLVLSGDKLEIVTTANAENPLIMDKPALFTCDVWEHAYYLDYQNRRPDFLKTFLDHLVNWERAAELYATATSKRSAA